MTNSLTKTLLAMAGDQNVITVYRSFVEFTGSLEAGMMLSQLLYWTPRTGVEGGWVAKSDKEWMKELCLTRYSTRKASTRLEGMKICKTKKAMFKGANTTHYKLDLDALTERWTDWLDSDIRLSENGQTSVRNQTNGLSENGQTITETTIDQTENDPLPDPLNLSTLAVGKQRKEIEPINYLADVCESLFPKMSIPKLNGNDWTYKWNNPLEEIRQLFGGVDQAEAFLRSLPFSGDDQEQFTAQNATSPKGLTTAARAREKQSGRNGFKM